MEAIAVQNDLIIMVDKMQAKNPDISREDLLKLIGIRQDPAAVKQDVLAAYAQRKEVILPEYENDVTSDITYDDLTTEAQRTGYKLMAQSLALKTPTRISNRLDANRIAREKGERTLERHEGKYNEVQTQLSDVKELEAEARKSISAEFRQLLKDIKVNSRADQSAGEAAGLLRSLMPELKAKVYPKQFEALLRKLRISDDAPLFIINKELMTLDLDWENTNLKDLYYNALEQIREKIRENPDNPLSLLLSGPAFERGDATLRTLAENDQLAKLKGSALLSAMVTFVKKNKVQAQALALSQESAEEQVFIAEELQRVASFKTQSSIDQLKAELRRRPQNSLRDRLVIQMANLRSKVLAARRAIQKEKDESGVLQRAHGEAQKHYDLVAKRLGLQDNWELYDGSVIPTQIDINATPEDVLSGKGSTLVEVNLQQNSLPAQQRRDLSTELARQGRAIQQYLLANRELEDSYAYSQLSIRAEKLIGNVIDSDMTIATSAKRDIFRSAGDRVAQSGTVGGRWFAQATRNFDRIKQGYKKFVMDGARVSGKRNKALKVSGIKSEDLLNEIYNSAITYLENERVLTGAKALDNMIDTLRLNPTYRSALQSETAQDAFKDWINASIEMGRRAVEISAKEGNLVKDTVGGQTIYRDHLNRGVGMIPRRLNMAIFTMMNSFSAANPGFLDPAQSPFVQKEGETIEDFEARAQSAIAAVRGFQEDIVDPILLNDRADIFPEPNNEGIRLTSWEVRQAWNQSGGNPVATARILAESYGVDPEVYIPSFLESFTAMLAKLNKMATESEAQREAGTYGPIITQSKYGSEARVGNDVPSQMTTYTQFSESQNEPIISRIAGEAAFGRDYEGLVKNAMLVEDEIRNKAVEFEEAIYANKVDGKVNMKAVRKALGNKFKELKAAYKAHKVKDYRAKNIIARFNAILNSADLASDIGNFEEAHSFIVTGMLQGWTTALKQASQIYSTTASMRAISRFNFLDPFTNLLKTAKAFMNWPFRLFGYEPFGLAYGDQIIEHDLNEQEQQLRVDESMHDSGVNIEMGKDEASKFKQKTRGIRNLINRVSVGPKGNFLFPGPTLFLFRPVNQISLTIGTSNMMGYMERLANYGNRYLAQNPEADITNLRAIRAEDLGFKDRMFGFDDASFWNNFLDLLHTNGVTFDQLVEKYNSNKDKGLPGLDGKDVQVATVMTKEVFSVESMLSTAPGFSKSSSLGRMSWSLMNWSVRTGAINFIDAVAGRKITGQKQEGYKQMQASIAGSKALMFSLLPAALLFSLFFDWVDEEVVGKKSDIRPLLKPNNLPEFGLSVLERVGRMGPFGIVGELGNSISNLGTGKPALSFDDRVIWASTILNIQNLLSTAISTEIYKNPAGITYNQFIRPLAYSMGLGSVLSNTQVVNNLLGLENAEARSSGRTNTQNALRGAGRTVGLEVRTFGAGGYSRAVPYTPHVTNMILSAMSNNGEQFQKSYQEAIKAMMDFKDVPRGEAADRVQRSYAQRHPIKAVFKSAPIVSEYKEMLATMSPSLRNDVQKSIESFNRWGETIGVKPYYGKQLKSQDKKKSLAIEDPTPTLEEQLLQSIKARYSL